MFPRTWALHRVPRWSRAAPRSLLLASPAAMRRRDTDFPPGSSASVGGMFGKLKRRPRGDMDFFFTRRARPRMVGEEFLVAKLSLSQIRPGAHRLSVPAALARPRHRLVKTMMAKPSGHSPRIVDDRFRVPFISGICKIHQRNISGTIADENCWMASRPISRLPASDSYPL